MSFDGGQITNLAVLGPYLYWIDKEKHAIERVNKSTGEVMEGNIVMNQSPHLIDIIAIYIPTHEVTILFICFSFLVFYTSSNQKT